MFGTWTNGSTLIPTISTKFKSNVLVIKNTRVNSPMDIRVIRAIQHKLFILAYETILCTIVHFIYILVLVNIISKTLVFDEFILLLNKIVLHKVLFILSESIINSSHNT